MNKPLIYAHTGVSEPQSADKVKEPLIYSQHSNQAHWGTGKVEKE